MKISQPFSGLIPIEQTYLPVGQMRQISRVTALCNDGITGEMDIGAKHWVYPLHFPGDPIFPGCLLVEAAGQLVALWAWADGQRGKPRYARTAAQFHGEVRPADGRLTLRTTVRRKRSLNFATVTILADTRAVATVEVVLAVVADAGG